MTAAFNLSQLANNLNTSGQLDATDGLTGAVPVANGGTGRATLTSNNLIAGNGTGQVNLIAPGTNGQVLQSNGTAWVAATFSAGSYVGQRAQLFTGNGTFTIPTGVTALKVTVIGGGGGGRGAGGNGGAGGNSSVASGTQTITAITANGGAGGTNNGNRSVGGAASNGDINIAGGGGGVGPNNTTAGFNPSGGASNGGEGSNSYYNLTFNCVPAPSYASPASGFFGSSGSFFNSVTGFGNGGKGGGTTSAVSGAGGGLAIKWLTGLTPGNTLSVTVGSAGTSASEAGTAGIVIIEW